MDDQGWLNISIIASFARIKHLSTDLNIIRDTMALTPLLEIRGSYVRLRGIWSEWLLPGAARSTVESAEQHEELMGGRGMKEESEVNSSLEIGSPKATTRALPAAEAEEKVVEIAEEKVVVEEKKMEEVVSRSFFACSCCAELLTMFSSMRATVSIVTHSMVWIQFFFSLFELNVIFNSVSLIFLTRAKFEK